MFFLRTKQQPIDTRKEALIEAFRSHIQSSDPRTWTDNIQKEHDLSAPSQHSAFFSCKALVLGQEKTSPSIERLHVLLGGYGSDIPASKCANGPTGWCDVHEEITLRMPKPDGKVVVVSDAPKDLWESAWSIFRPIQDGILSEGQMLLADVAQAPKSYSWERQKPFTYSANSGRFAVTVSATPWRRSGRRGVQYEVSLSDREGVLSPSSLPHASGDMAMKVFLTALEMRLAANSRNRFFEAKDDLLEYAQLIGGRKDDRYLDAVLGDDNMRDKYLSTCSVKSYPCPSQGWNALGSFARESFKTLDTQALIRAFPPDILDKHLIGSGVVKPRLQGLAPKDIKALIPRRVRTVLDLKRYVETLNKTRAQKRLDSRPSRLRFTRKDGVLFVGVVFKPDEFGPVGAAAGAAMMGFADSVQRQSVAAGFLRLLGAEHSGDIFERLCHKGRPLWNIMQQREVRTLLALHLGLSNRDPKISRDAYVETLTKLYSAANPLAALNAIYTEQPKDVPDEPPPGKVLNVRPNGTPSAEEAALLKAELRGFLNSLGVCAPQGERYARVFAKLVTRNIIAREELLGHLRGMENPDEASLARIAGELVKRGMTSPAAIPDASPLHLETDTAQSKMAKTDLPPAFKLKYYRDPTGCPFSDWLSTLHPEWQRRIRRRLHRMANGYFGDYKLVAGRLEDGKPLYEARFFGPNAPRIFFLPRRDGELLILGGSCKNDQQEKLDKAMQDLAKYLILSKSNHSSL